MHKSVLLQETIDLLAPEEGDIIADLTVGAGGHSKEILKRIGKAGVLIAIDKDENALKIARNVLSGKNVVFIHSDFKNIAEAIQNAGYEKVDGIIADLGVSSMQLDQSERGFSFKGHDKLDMRMDQTSQVTAADIVNTYSEEELAKIFREYGEEKFARKVAQKIVEQRKQSPIIWTDQLSEVVRGVIPAKGKIDPATKVFQALRIEVNGELRALESALPQMVRSTNVGGRIAIISFHSLEDRMVKQFFEKESKTCTCPPEFPKCICNAKPTLKKVTRKPQKASEEEIKANPRSRSAKLRVAERI
jgi:16S rRNA (cytosine1402-N4)-methyltransferase